MSFLRELFTYIRTKRKFVLIPVLLALALLGGLIVISKGSVVAPFIYTIF